MQRICIQREKRLKLGKNTYCQVKKRKARVKNLERNRIAKKIRHPARNHISKEKNSQIKKSTGEGGDSSENPPRKNNGDNHPACDADATHDPINLATGSLMAEYVDLGVEDTLGLYSLKRYYESAYKNTGGILGDMWRFGIESTVSQRGEFADVQMDSF